jgi:hypothetical protein
MLLEKVASPMTSICPSPSRLGHLPKRLLAVGRLATATLNTVSYSVSSIVSSTVSCPMHLKSTLERSHEPSENKRLHRFREEISAIVRGGYPMTPPRSA